MSKITAKQRRIGQALIEECLADGSRYRPTTAEICQDFEVPRSQVQGVKKAAREYAADVYGQAWGWDPGTECFRVVPNEDSTLAKRITLYAARHAADSVQCARHLMNTLNGQGFYDSAPDDIYRGVQRTWDQVQKVTDRAEVLTRHLVDETIPE